MPEVERNTKIVVEKISNIKGYKPQTNILNIVKIAFWHPFDIEKIKFWMSKMNIVKELNILYMVSSFFYILILWKFFLKLMP